MVYAGRVIFSTNASERRFGNLTLNTHYTISGNTLNLKLDTEYEFSYFELKSGTTLSTTDDEGSVLYLNAPGGMIKIDGNIDLKDKIKAGKNSYSITINGETFNNPSTADGGSTLKTSTNGFGAGGAGGYAGLNYGGVLYSGNGGEGSSGNTPFGTAGATKTTSYNLSSVGGIGENGNNATNYSAGGSGATAINITIAGTGTAYAYGGAGGTAYGANGSNGNIGYSPGASGGGGATGGGGGGAGGTAGKPGIHCFIQAHEVIINGTINTSGGNAGNGGNGGKRIITGAGWVPESYSLGGYAGGGGGGGNAGDIIIKSVELTNNGTLTKNKGLKGSKGQRYNYDTLQEDGSASDGTDGTDGEVTTTTIEPLYGSYTTDWVNPDTIISSDTGYPQYLYGYNNKDNIKIDDNNNASRSRSWVDGNSLLYTDCSDFNINIPNNAIIKSVEIKVNAQSSHKYYTTAAGVTGYFYGLQLFTTSYPRTTLNIDGTATISDEDLWVETTKTTYEKTINDFNDKLWNDFNPTFKLISLLRVGHIGHVSILPTSHVGTGYLYYVAIKINYVIPLLVNYEENLKTNDLILKNTNKILNENLKTNDLPNKEIIKELNNDIKTNDSKNNETIKELTENIKNYELKNLGINFQETMKTLEELNNTYYIGAYDLFIYTNLYDHSRALYDESVYDGFRVAWIIPGVKILDIQNKTHNKILTENFEITELTHWPISLNRTETTTINEILSKNIVFEKTEETKTNDLINKKSNRVLNENIKTNEIIDKLLNKVAIETTLITESQNKEYETIITETAELLDIANKSHNPRFTYTIKVNDVKTITVILLETINTIEHWKYPLQRRPNITQAKYYPSKTSIIRFNPKIQTLPEFVTGISSSDSNNIRISKQTDNVNIKSGTQ